MTKNNWQKMRISDVAKIISGGTPKTSIAEYWGGNIGWLSVVDFNNDDRFVFDTEKTITQKGVDNSNTKFLEVGDVIISARGTVGALAQIGKKMCFNQSCFGLRGKKDVLENDYLFYWLRNFVQVLRAKSQGSVFETINLNTFDFTEITLPPLPTQTAIARTLSLLDDKIELNRKINAELEKTARLIYDYIFIQNKKKEWKVEKLKNLLTFEKGSEPGSSAYSDKKENADFVKFYRVGDIDGDCKTFVDKTACDLVFAKPHDVIVTFDGSVGKIGIGLDGAISGGLQKISDPSGKFDNAMIWLWFLDQRIQATIKQYATGSVLLHASRSIEYLEVPIPDISTLRRFQSQVAPMFAQIIANRQESARLAALRDWLLPMLMNGQAGIASAQS
jgi:type I restriction enzyme S subunit